MVKTFEKYKVLNERELHARYEIALETYIKTVNVEAQLMVLMANRYILPAALEYQKDVAESVKAVRDGGRVNEGSEEAARPASRRSSTSSACGTDKLAKALEHHAPSAEKHAKFMRDTVVPAMAALRETGDQIELHRAARDVAAADVSGDAVHQSRRSVMVIGDRHTAIGDRLRRYRHGRSALDGRW